MSRDMQYVFARTGPFAGLIQEYLVIAADKYSDPRLLDNLLSSLKLFFGYLVMSEQITTLDEICPSVMSRFFAATNLGRDRTKILTCHISGLFKWLMVKGRFDGTNSGTMPNSRYRPEGVICHGPNCSNVLSSGMLQLRQQDFCSTRCYQSDYVSRHTVGECEHCHGPIKRSPNKSKKARFCSREHQTQFHDDRIFKLTGPFGGLIKEYLAVTTTYGKLTLTSVKPSLTHFFAHVFLKENIKTIEEIGPSVVTRFIAAEGARGMTSSNAVGHISTFFNWLIDEERLDKRNPVVPRIHSQASNPTQARPYTDRDLEFNWNLVEASGDLALMLAFAIGEECGLRVGEVCNIRLSDIDHEQQNIFVRLPTKTKRTRDVPYGEKVKKYLKLWLPERDSKCPHDHLIHGPRLAFHLSSDLDARFKNLLRNSPAPADSFCFHRLRHSWATRLMNNGMRLEVLMEIGGWKSMNSLQKYLKVLPSTIRSQYEESYRKIQEKLGVAPEQSMSLMDYALMDTV